MVKLLASSGGAAAIPVVVGILLEAQLVRMEDALRADDGVGGRSIGRSTLTATVSLSLVAVVAKASARAMIQAEAMATSVVEVMTVELAEETLQAITETLAE